MINMASGSKPKHEISINNNLIHEMDDLNDFLFCLR